MALPSFRSSAQVAYAAGTTLTGRLPSGVAAGDHYVSIVALDGDRSGTLNIPSGWTRQSIDYDATMRATFAIDTAPFGAAAPAYTWGGTSINRGSVIGAWSGAASSSAIHGYARSAGTSTAPSVTGPTTDTADELVLWIVFQLSLSEPSGLPASFTSRVADARSTGATIADLGFARTGSSSGTLTGGLGSSTRWIAATLAIRSTAPSAGGTVAVNVAGSAVDSPVYVNVGGSPVAAAGITVAP